MLESSHHRNGYWLRGQNIFISCSDITKRVHTCHSVWVTSFCECGWAGGAVYNQGRLCVLWDGLAQRSGRGVLLGKSLQTGCFDEPESIKWMLFFLHTELLNMNNRKKDRPDTWGSAWTSSPHSPGNVSLRPLVWIDDLDMCVTQSLCTQGFRGWNELSWKQTAKPWFQNQFTQNQSNTHLPPWCNYVKMNWGFKHLVESKQ